MIICLNCKKEMVCHKTGSVAHFGNGHLYAADTFKCSCGNMIMRTNAVPYYGDENYIKEARKNLKEHFVEMI